MRLYDLIIKEISEMGIAVESENETDAVRTGTSRCLLKVKENPEDENICRIRLIIEEAKPDIDDFIYKENDDPNAVTLRRNVKDLCKLLNADSFFTEEELEDMIDELPWNDFDPMKEIEFMEMMDEIYLGDEVSQYYIETNFGKIHFLLDVYFWVERTEFSSGNDGKIYYQLYDTSIYNLVERYSLKVE